MQVPEVPESSALRYRVERRTRWCDEDRFGVLNNAIYMTLFEEARLAYFEQLGVIEDGQFPFLLAQTNVRFLAPGRGGQRVTLEMATKTLGTKSIVQVYRVRGQDGTAWCEAEALLVTVDVKTLQTKPMASALRAAITDFEGLD